MINLLNFYLLVSFGVASIYGNSYSFICELGNFGPYNVAFIGNGEYSLEYDLLFSITTNEDDYFVSKPIQQEITTIYDGTLANVNVFDFAVPIGFYTNAENLQLVDLIGDYAIYNLDIQTSIYLNNDFNSINFNTTLYIELDVSTDAQLFEQSLENASYYSWSSDIEVNYENVMIDSYNNGYSVGVSDGYARGEQDGYNNGYAIGYEQGVEDSGVKNLSWVDWLVNAVGGFFEFEIFPNFTLGQVFGSIVTIFIALWLLKVMAGG